MARTPIRQGDVSLWPVELSESKTSSAKIVENPILAFGEVTGTKHQIQSECLEYKDPATGALFYQILEEGGVLEQTGPGSHHTPMKIEKGGWYEAHVAREQNFYEGVERRTVD